MVKDENMNIIIEWRIVAKSTPIEWPYMTPILNGNVSTHSIPLKLKKDRFPLMLLTTRPIQNGPVLNPKIDCGFEFYFVSIMMFAYKQKKSCKLMLY